MSNQQFVRLAWMLFAAFSFALAIILIFVVAYEIVKESWIIRM